MKGIAVVHGASYALEVSSINRQRYSAARTASYSTGKLSKDYVSGVPDLVKAIGKSAYTENCSLRRQCHMIFCFKFFS